MIKRVEILVYINYKAALIQQMKDFGADIEYVNKKAGYCVCYIDGPRAKKFTDFLRRAKGVKKFEFSPTELVEIDI
ncbi:DUF2129 domain-containing protein [bacterium]|nr:DUF2129 domain-containing protein [bacterium]